MSNRVRCTECGRLCAGGEIFTVDAQSVCRTCLFGAVEPLCIYPIGIVVNGLERNGTDFGRTDSGEESRIELAAGQRRFLYRLEDEAALTVVYWLHRARPVRSRFRRGLDGKETGLFATRTPDRLSRLGIQDVRLLAVRDTVLYVQGLDAVNGTPVLDIKMCRHAPGKET